MSRNSLVTTIVFVAGLGIGFFARSAMGTHLRKDTHAADLAAIEKLHQEDIEATLSQDPKGLIYIWTEDAVRFNQAGRLRSAGRPSRLKIRKSTPSTRDSRC